MHKLLNTIPPKEPIKWKGVFQRSRKRVRWKKRSNAMPKNSSWSIFHTNRFIWSIFETRISTWSIVHWRDRIGPVWMPSPSSSCNASAILCNANVDPPPTLRNACIWPPISDSFPYIWKDSVKSPWSTRSTEFQFVFKDPRRGELWVTRTLSDSAGVSLSLFPQRGERKGPVCLAPCVTPRRATSGGSDEGLASHCTAHPSLLNTRVPR